MTTFVNKGAVATISYFLGGLPLIAYPAVIVADIMAIAGSGGYISNFIPTNLSEGLMFFIIVGSTIYPVLWLVCVWASLRAFKRDKGTLALKLSVFPVFFSISLVLAIWLQ